MEHWVERRSRCGAGSGGNPADLGVSFGIKATTTLAAFFILTTLTQVSARSGGMEVALTFDDGPDPILTPILLDILRDNQAKATFFPIGEKVPRHQTIVREIAEAGHEIGNHGWGHLKMTRLGRGQVRNEILRTSEAIEMVTGIRPRIFRPPHGLIDQRLREIVLSDGGLVTVTWNLTCGDWKAVSQESIEAEILGGVRGGSVILMHDINPRTVEAMRRVIPELRRRGFVFSTLSDLARGAIARGGDAD